MIATDIRPLAHVYASCIPFRKHIWLKTINFNPLTWPFDLHDQFEMSWQNIYLIRDSHNHRERHQNPVSSSFRLKVTADCVSVVDDRHGRAAMLDFSSNMTSTRKIDRSGVSGCVKFRRNWYKIWVSNPTRSKLVDAYLQSGGHFVFHAPVALCHGFSKSTSWSVERYGM